MRNTKILLVLLFLIISSDRLAAKETYPQEDTKLWVNAQVEYDLNKDWEIGFEQELRYYQDITKLEQWLTNVGIGYAITNIFKTSLYYRHRVMPDDEEIRNEVYANFSFSPYFGNFELNNRVRLHLKLRDEDEPIYLFRYRLNLEYRISKLLTPYLSGEIFYRLNYDKGDRLTQARYKAGCDISITSTHTFDLYFMRELEYNSNKIVNSSIFGFGYKFRF